MTKDALVAVTLSDDVKEVSAEDIMLFKTSRTELRASLKASERKLLKVQQGVYEPEVFKKIVHN